MISASRVPLLFLWSFAACGQAQTVNPEAFPAPHWTWAWTPEGDQSSYGTAITADPGGAYVTGFYDGGLYEGHGGARLGTYDLPVRGEMNAFVVRLDTLGHVVWARGYGDSGRLSTSALARGPQGVLYVVGQLGPAIMSGEEGRWEVNPRPLVSAEDRAFVAQLDTTGTVQWGRLIDGMATAEGVAVDGEGNVYVGGSAGVPPSLGTPGDAIMASFSADGNLRWDRTVAEGTWATVKGVTATSYGVCAAGQVEEAVDAPDSSLSGFIVGYSSDGEPLWKRVLSASPSPQGSGGSVSLYGAASDPADGCYVAGGFAGILGIGDRRLMTQDDPERFAPRAHTDAAVLKVDGRGELAWAAQLEGGPVSDFAHSVVVGLDGRVVTVGTFMGPARWGPDTLSVPYRSGGHSPRALFAGLLDPDGTPLHAAQSMSSAVMSASWVAVGGDGSYYATGRMGDRVYVARLRW